jgi:EasF-like predicted methyltransferase
LRKIEILLKAFERARKHVEYFALDLSIAELSRTFARVATADYEYVKFFALHGTYDDGLAWLSEKKGKPTAILTMGSSIGNFSRAEAAEFLGSFAQVLGPADFVIVGLDGCQDPEKVYRAYNDSKGMTEWFYRNGLDHANILLGQQAFKQSEWDVVGRYDDRENKHEASYIAQADVRIGKVRIAKGETLKLEDAYKYSETESDELWHAAGLVPQASYANQDHTYCRPESSMNNRCFHADQLFQMSTSFLQQKRNSRRLLQNTRYPLCHHWRIGNISGRRGTLSPSPWCLVTN